jgi:hypothetical protein
MGRSTGTAARDSTRRAFAAILDADHGGLFRIAPDGEGWTSRQLYLPDTNVRRSCGCRHSRSLARDRWDTDCL